MNTFAVFVAVAMLASMVNATPCTDICNAQCEIQKNTCTFAELFGNLCDTVNGVCTPGLYRCMQLCLTAALLNVEESTPSVKLMIPLLHLLDHSQLPARRRCNFNLLAGVVNALGGGAASFWPIPGGRRVSSTQP
ncbi:hypothetical protein RRG08_065895 [Elysia crispata]|uniref:Uncharacterized protein n=1 Tax=Elysia crispata TaxID=231223 RepID=A0AAE0YZW1_9GAST|nr:hypothetical protein RRG08_065895 [Elysia crispata]